MKAARLVLADVIVAKQAVPLAWPTRIALGNIRATLVFGCK